MAAQRAPSLVAPAGAAAAQPRRCPAWCPETDTSITGGFIFVALTLAVVLLVVAIGSWAIAPSCGSRLSPGWPVACSGNGTCVDGSCSCLSGFTGERCELGGGACEADCGRHGSCVDGVCVCTDGFVGGSCDTHSACAGFHLTVPDNLRQSVSPQQGGSPPPPTDTTQSSCHTIMHVLIYVLRTPTLVRHHLRPVTNSNATA